MAVMMVPSMLNSITACDLPIAAIWPARSAVFSFCCGDVGRELHHPERLALLVEHRVVGGENPDLLAALADPLVFAGLVFAAVERCPELAIGRAVALACSTNML